jgi:hypothetical protein
MTPDFVNPISEMSIFLQFFSKINNKNVHVQHIHKINMRYILNSIYLYSIVSHILEIC